MAQDPGKLNDIQKLTRGRSAQRLMDDPVLRATVQAVEEDITEEWKQTDPTDPAARERAYAKYQALNEVWRKLKQFWREAEYVERLGEKQS